MIKMIKPLTSNKKEVYMTPKGLAEAKSELSQLKTEKRVEIAERISRARDFGDLSENSEYDAALEEQTLVENRIDELEELLKNVRIIQELTPSDSVVIGSTIRLSLDGKMDEFTIVGKVEADPAKKRISNESPLGSALLGAKAGDTVEVVTPTVRYKTKVLAIK